MGHLYRITSPSRKSYIGITSGAVATRWKRHISRAHGSASASQSPALSQAIRKYGEKVFQVETLLIADWNYLRTIEPLAIQAFASKSPNGYNISEGGDGSPGVCRTQDHRRKISLAMSGRTLSEEHKKRIGDALRGRRRPEHSRKMSQIMTEIWARRKENSNG